MAIYYPPTVKEIQDKHSKIKTFSEITENDLLYFIDIDKCYQSYNVYKGCLSLKQHTSEYIYEISINHKMYPEYKTDENYEYDAFMINVRTPDGKIIKFDTFDNASFVFDFDNNYLLCTCKNGADIAIQLIRSKCSIQAQKFKSLFNGQL